MKTKQIILSTIALALATSFISNSALAVLADDVVCAGCVHATDLVDKAVTKDKIRGGAVTSAKIRNNAIVTKKIKDGVVTSIKIDPAYTAEIARISCLATGVVQNGKCYYLDGVNGACAAGSTLAPQSILATIGTSFAGKYYRTTASNNCCIAHADQAAEGQDYGMGASDCNTNDAFVTGAVLGGASCTDAQQSTSKQLTLCEITLD